MNLYIVKDGHIVEAATGRVINLSSEEERLDRQPEPRRAIDRMVSKAIAASQDQRIYL